MFGLGMSEIIFLAILALVVVGPKELPQLARTLGRFLNELKRSTNMLSEEFKLPKLDDFDLDSAINRSEQVRRREKEIHDQQMAQHQHHDSNEPEQLSLEEQNPDDSTDTGNKGKA